MLEVDSKKMLELCRQRIKLASEAESIEFRLRKATSSRDWYKRAAKEADIILDENLYESLTDSLLISKVDSGLNQTMTLTTRRIH